MLRLLLLIAVALCGLSLSARAGEVRVGSLLVQDAWSRATPGGARVGAGYVTFENVGATPDRLVGAEAEVAARVEIHETAEAGGVSRMKPLESLTVAPGARIELKPNGYHLMLTDLKRPLKRGERFGGTLVFETAGRIAVEFEVRAIGAGTAHGAH